VTTRTGSTRHDRPPVGALVALYVGLLLTLAATAAPYVDRATGQVLAAHLRAGYPSYTQARIDTAVTTWSVLLTAVGVLGLAGWVATIRAVRTGRSWARWEAVAMLGAGVAVALTALLTRDTSGDVGLAPLLGVIGLLPPLAGVVAVVLLWRAPVTRG
jgi:hypothetical protein